MKGGPTKLPDLIDPVRLAESRTRLAGQLPLTRLRRLQPLLLSDEDCIEINADFGVDEQGLRIVHIRARAALQMTCQRCLQPVTVGVDLDTTLALFSSESEAGSAGSQQHETLVLSGQRTSLAEMIEDELLLQVPMIPRHADQGTCADPVGQGDTQETHRDSPFATLAALRDKK